MPIDCKVRSTTPELVLFVYCYKKLSVEDVEVFTTFFNGYLEGDIPFKALFDLREVDTAPMKAITAMAKHMSEFETLAPGKVVATSVLVSSKGIEGLINMLFAIKKPVTPTKVTASLEKACDFLNKYDSSVEIEN